MAQTFSAGLAGELIFGPVFSGFKSADSLQGFVMELTEADLQLTPPDARLGLGLAI